MARGRLLATVILVVAASGCEQLGLIENNRTRIRGDWYKVEMGFPEGDPYDFESGVISKNMLEVGNFQWEGYEHLKVTLHGSSSTYFVDYPDEDTMVWYVETRTGRRKAQEWSREGPP
jgi:hypothetical protein